MPRDRYLKIILTVIAIELGWLGVKDLAVPVSAQQTKMVLWRAPSLDCVTLRREMTFGGNANPPSSTRLELVTLSLTEDATLFQLPKFKEVPPSEFHTAIARYFGGEPNELMKRRFADMDKAYQEQRKRK